MEQPLGRVDGANQLVTVPNPHADFVKSWNSNAAIDFLRILEIPAHFYSMFLYVATLILLSFTSKKAAVPKALGMPYDKGHR